MPLVTAENKESGQQNLLEMGQELTARDSHSSPKGPLDEVLGLET